MRSISSHRKQRANGSPGAGAKGTALTRSRRARTFSARTLCCRTYLQSGQQPEAATFVAAAAVVANTPNATAIKASTVDFIR
jgi:hypothetical protein